MQKPVKILQASAGSGKTFSLAVHYLTLLFSGEHKYREILAVTFTNKATEEMKTRILKVLKGFARGDESKEIDDYRQLVLKEHPKLNAETIKLQADKIYRRILHDYSRFSVNTIDGFVQKVIRGFAFELGLDAAYTLEMNIDKVKENLVERLDKELDKKPELVDWLIRLAKERIEDNKSWNYKGELLNLTGEIFKERFAVFEEALNGIGLENINQVFTDFSKAAKESVNAFEDELASIAQKGVNILQKHGLEANHLKGKSKNQLLKLHKFIKKEFKDLDKIFGLIDDPESWFQKDVPQDSYDEINPILKELQSFYTASLPDYILNQQFNKNVYFLRLMVELASLLKDYRKESGSLLISDAQNLLSGITEDAGDNPSFIWEKIGNRYKNFLFDEFQDTSVSQWSSFLSLVLNAVAEHDGELIDNLIVGDTKQSIYRWRNGDWNILHSGAKGDLGEHNVLDAYLEENYRSSTHIIAFNNALFKKIPELIQHKLNEDVKDSVNETLNAWWIQKKYQEIITSIYGQAEQKITPKTPEGGIIRIRKFVKKEDEERVFSDTVFREYALVHIIKEIQDLKDNHQYQYKDICVLVRSNKEAVETVEALMQAQLPVVSGEALLIANNAAIQLIVNTLYALVGYEENTSLYKANCIALYNKISKNDLAHANYVNLRYKSFTQLEAFLPEDLCKNAQTWVQLPLAELVEKLIKSYGLDQQKAHIPYLLAFRDIIGNASKAGEKGIHSFLTWWNQDGIRKALPSPEEVNAIQILTIHKSKGLAFRAVLVPFCDFSLGGKSNGVFWVPTDGTPYKLFGSIPLKYNKELGKSSIANYYFEEELYSHMDSLNMLYVATTRTKDYLFLGIKGKSSDELSNIGDVLNHIYKEDLKEEQEYQFQIGEHLVQVAQQKDKNTIILEHYPTSDRISEIYEALEDKQIDHLLNMETAARKGSILHDILAGVKTKDDIEPYVTDLNITGIIRLDEMEDFISSARQVLMHPELEYLLSRADTTVEEKSIVNINGELKRPDKVLLCGEEVVIIDYKFTLEEHDSHVKQVLEYKELFNGMGYPKVNAYLFYAITKKLKAVH